VRAVQDDARRGVGERRERDKEEKKRAGRDKEAAAARLAPDGAPPPRPSQAASKDFGDAVTIVRIDTDAYPALATRFQVRALPTLVLFRGGAPVDRVEGLVSAQALTERVNYYARGLDKTFGRR